MTGAHYEIAVDGKPLSYRDAKETALESAQYLKKSNPNVDVTVRDLETGEMIVVKSRPA